MSQREQQPKKKRSILQTIGALLLVALIAIFAPEWLVDDEERSGDSNATFVRVVDGDTIRVMYEGKEEPVRYLLIDTPESVKPNEPEQCYGKEASDVNEQLLKKGELELVFDEVGGKRDKYDRLLAHIYVDGKNVQEELLRRGLARVAFVYNKEDPHLDRYNAAQDEAKRNKVGIWSEDERFVTRRGFDDAFCTP